MPNTIIKKCKNHGETPFVLEKYRNVYRCRKCRVEAVTKNRRNRKLKLVQYFGGKCVVCGYDKCQQALQFHHLDPNKKEFAISKSGLCRSWKRMLTEAEKCILVCCRCHAEIENGIISCPVGMSGDCSGLLNRRAEFDSLTGLL